MNLDVLKFSAADAIKMLCKHNIHEKFKCDFDCTPVNSNYVFLVINEKDLPIDFDVKCELNEIEGIELLADDSFIPSIDFSIGEDLPLVV